MARITDESILMDRVVKMLPKGVPSDAIASVECDPYDGANGGGSYWVYLDAGWRCVLTDCHTIHEDTLREVRPMLKSVERWDDDPELLNW